MKSLCKIEEPESDELDEIIEKDLTFCKHPESRGEVKQFSKNISKAYAKSVLDKLLEESFDTGLESDKSIYTQGANNANDFWKVKITKLKSEV